MIDVAHPCWTGVESEFDHDYKVEDIGQGDGIYYQAGWIRVCECCGDVDENWDGGEAEDDYGLTGGRY